MGDSAEGRRAAVYVQHFFSLCGPTKMGMADGLEMLARTKRLPARFLHRSWEL